jgi:hypothetical protein
VKISATVICVAAWIVAAVTQLVVSLGLPDKVVAFGVDISHASHMLLVKQAVYVACGLALAIAACVIRKWRFPLVIVSALFYLLHWFPWRAVSTFGLSATANSMHVLGTTPGLRFTSLVRDVILPIAFAAVIALAIRETRKPSVLSESR